MDDDENDAQLIDGLRAELAAQKVALFAILQVLATQYSAATEIVLQDMAEAEARLTNIDQPVAEAISDLIAEIEVRVG